jgi:isoamylase
MKSNIRVLEGRAFPYGAQVTDTGVNFALFSLHATGVSLVLYEREDSLVPMHVIPLDPLRHRDRFVWHVLVAGLAPGAWFVWRVDGPNDLGHGGAFDARRDLLDPAARRISTALWTRDAEAADNRAMRGQVVAAPDYDWEGDRVLGRPRADAVI